MGLFSVDVDIVPTKIGEAAHVILPAATSGEMNLTSMNGERRMRLTERYMDPPGQAMPDCLIAARLANHMERAFRALGKPDIAGKFTGFDWKTEEDAFMDGYHQHEKGGEFVTYARLRAMGTNGFQEPAVGLESTGAVAAGDIHGRARRSPEGPRHRGCAREGARAEGRAHARGCRAYAARRHPADHRHEAPVCGREVQRTGREGDLHAHPMARPPGTGGSRPRRTKFPYLINNGRANLVWQSAYLDVENELVMDRWPFPFIEMNPQDMAELNLKEGDLVEVYNDNGSTQAMAYPTPTAKRKQAFMLFAYPTGVQGNVVSAGVNEFIIPNYKQTWGSIKTEDLRRPGRRRPPHLQVEGIHGIGPPAPRFGAGPSSPRPHRLSPPELIRKHQ